MKRIKKDKKKEGTAKLFHKDSQIFKLKQDERKSVANSAKTGSTFKKFNTKITKLKQLKNVVPEYEKKATNMQTEYEEEQVSDGDIERVQRGSNKSTFTIYPDNNLKKVWDIAGCFLIAYWSFYKPF